LTRQGKRIWGHKMIFWQEYATHGEMKRCPEKRRKRKKEKRGGEVKQQSLLYGVHQTLVNNGYRRERKEGGTNSVVGGFTASGSGILHLLTEKEKRRGVVLG